MAFTFACIAQAEPPAGFRGWQGLRVLRQDGQPARFHAADVDADGRDELIVVNYRQSRLDIYDWLEPQQRQPGAPTDPREPNELPMAPEFRRIELPIPQLPMDAAVHQVDGVIEILVLVASPNRLLAYRHQEPGDSSSWKEARRWELLPGAYSGRDALLQARAGDSPSVLISCNEGIQQVTLADQARAAWLDPKEGLPRLDWWQADLDGDGDTDLIEWTGEATRSIRWYEAAGDRLLPPQVIYDQAVDAASVLRREGQAAEILLLGGTQSGLLRRMALERGQPSDFGRHEALPLTGGARAAWAGMKLGDQPALVVLDPSQPRVLTYTLGNQGWQAAESYPVISDVQAMMTPPAQPQTLLLWTREGGDLHRSTWEGGRLSYPKPMGLGGDAQSARILGMGVAGRTAWWIQKLDDDINLYLWPEGQEEPQATRFSGTGGKALEGVWLGAQRLLILDQYAKNPRLVTLQGDKAESSEPAHLKKVRLDEFRLIAWHGEVRPARLASGVLQWLDDQLHPVDQVMLPEGQRLASFVPLEGDQAWALEQAGQFVHRLAPDAAGIMRVEQSIKLPGGAELHHDPVLGMLLGAPQTLTHLASGQPWQLNLRQSVDSRVGRPSGVMEATINRMFVTDVTGQRHDNIALCDDKRHQLTVLVLHDDELVPALSWPVYEDQAYPYGYAGETLVTEPRLVRGLDLDGDDARDLAMLAHDRLLLYLGREEGRSSNE